MRAIKIILVGILFGIILTKSEVISWFRIQEMFRFHSFHMYGIIGSAVLLGMIITAFIKKASLRSLYGDIINIKSKEFNFKAALFGGTIFGLGWAMTGACPGPLYSLVGNGYWLVLIAIASAIIGTYTYGAIRDKLPH